MHELGDDHDWLAAARDHALQVESVRMSVKPGHYTGSIQQLTTISLAIASL